MKIASSVPTPGLSGMPFVRYRPFLDTNPTSVPDRRWPDQHLTKAPRWMSADLRDGNQALIEPMDSMRKRKMFDLLVDLGYKEIKIGFSAASQTDFDFVRSLVEAEVVPEDVTISVLTQSRPEIIERTPEALVGLPCATVHLYNATSPLLREFVFRNDKAQTVDLVISDAREVIAQTEERLGDETIFGFEYSPEIFVDTEPEFALETCKAVMDVWQPEADHEIILNLPATVERAIPNVYADQIEYMSRNLSRREHITLSVHPYSDRGTGIAAAKLALLAGVGRAEGCLLGQDKRTGSVDLVTLSLNLFSQGIDPGVDFSHVNEIRETVEFCTSMSTSPKAPYVGDLVYTSFSDSHQDAIKKGFAERKKRVEAAGGDENAVVWELPYLPIDPHDVGRSYEVVVRANSQSDKGGVAYLMSATHNLELPRRLQVEFSRIVQRHTDKFGGEIDGDALWSIFADEYPPYSSAKGLTHWGRFELGPSRMLTSSDSHVEFNAVLNGGGTAIEIFATGSGPVDAFVSTLHDLGFDARALGYSEHAMSQGRDAKTAAYVEAVVDGQIVWGVSIDSLTTQASYKTVISAMNRTLC